MPAHHLASTGRGGRRHKKDADVLHADEGLPNSEAKTASEDEGWDSTTASGGIALTSKIWTSAGPGESWVPTIRPSKTALLAAGPKPAEDKEEEQREDVQQYSWKEVEEVQDRKEAEDSSQDAEDGTTEPTFMEEQTSRIKPREYQPGPSLAQLRAEVDSNLRRASRPRLHEVLQDNAKKSLELQQALSQLDEEGETWVPEVGFWQKEVMRLKAEIEEQQRLEEKAEAARTVKAEQELHSQIRDEVMAASLADRQLAELEKEQARCEAAADEAESRNAKLRQRLEQNAALGRGGGTAHLFVTALPGLDATALEFAQRALDEHLKQMALQNLT